MSHIVSIKTRIKDRQALAAACRRLGLEAPVQGTAQLFNASATGLIVQLPQWHYPIVIDPAKGEIQYDNFSEAWGKQSELDKLLQAYSVEKAKLEARRSGHSVTEQALANGSIKLTVKVAGAA